MPSINLHGSGVRHLAATCILSVISYFSLYFAFGDTFLPTNECWSLLLLLAAATVGGHISSFVRLPPLLGMLLAGMILRNLPGDPVGGLPDSWSTGFRSAALSIILLRSGLELDLVAFRQVGAVAARLTAAPGLSEALLVGGAAMLLFKMPFFLGFSLGFILAAVSPAVVVSSMFDLQRRGFGVAKGIPSLVVAAASFDDVVAITGFSLFIGLAVPDGNLAWSILHGPLNVVLGLAGGAIGGIILSATKLWPTHSLKVFTTFLVAMCIMFAAHHFHFGGAGALGSLALGISLNIVWKRGSPVAWSVGPDPLMASRVEHSLSLLWSHIAQPLLFSLIGAAVDFGTVEASTIPKAIIITLAGLAVRLPMAFGISYGAKLSLKERAFVAVSWIPKATVQAALASVPLDLIEEIYTCDDISGEELADCLEERGDYLRWGKDILTTSVFCILLTAPVGLILISWLGPKWLNKQAVVMLNESVVDLIQLEQPAAPGAGGVRMFTSPMSRNSSRGGSPRRTESQNTKTSLSRVSGGLRAPSGLGRLSSGSASRTGGLMKPPSMRPEHDAVLDVIHSHTGAGTISPGPTLFDTHFPELGKALDTIEDVADAMEGTTAVEETEGQEEADRLRVAVFAIKKQWVAASMGPGRDDDEEMQGMGRFFRMAASTAVAVPGADPLTTGAELELAAELAALGTSAPVEMLGSRRRSRGTSRARSMDGGRAGDGVFALDMESP